MSEYFNLDDSNHNSLNDSKINPIIDLVEKKNNRALVAHLVGLNN